MGATLAYRATGYGTVYAIEILMLLVTLVVLGPVIGLHLENRQMTSESFGLSEFPT
jgi:MFS transporter, BCD family, chlorophyll transporter